MGALTRIEGDPKEVTLVKKASGWYAHITCELPDIPKVASTDAIAVDVGTTHYLTTSGGTSLDRDHNAAINILLRAATALRGERWITDLYEARNTNEAQVFRLG